MARRPESPAAISRASLLARAWPLLLIALLVLLAQGRVVYAAPLQVPPPVPKSYPPSTPTVDVPGVRVIDGDTIEIWNGRVWGIRLIGVDAPAGNTDCGRQAIGRMWELLGGGAHMEQELPFDLDAAGQRLYHVFTTSSQNVGQTLISEGLAKAKDVQHQYRGAYNAAEAQARAAGRGCLWGAGAAQSLTPSAALLQSGGIPSASPLALAGGFSQDVVVSGLNLPTVMAFVPDGRIFIAEKSGLVQVFKNGALLGTPLIDIRGRVNDYWDRGLIGMAVDPNFAANGYIYLLYTYENNTGDYEGFKTGRLARYTVSGDTASLGSEVVLLGTSVGAGCVAAGGSDCLPSESASHSVGALKFAADGSLFVTSGDGASFNFVDDDALRSQNVDSLGGKLLRITSSGQGIPGNPFYNGNPSANRSKVYAYGMRNPYRFNLRADNGTPYVGDVGWGDWEEVSAAPVGGNMGWPCYEGPNVQPGYASKTTCQALYNLGAGATVPPIVSWNHSEGVCCSAAVTGGIVYSGTSYPASYQGHYFYGDYSKEWIRQIAVDGSNVMVPGSMTDFQNPADAPVDIELGPDQNIYYVSISTGEVRRLRYVGGGNRQPTAKAAATPTSGPAPLNVQFSSAGTFDPDADALTYAWTFGDGGTSNQPNPSHTYAANGTYNVGLTVTDPSNASAVATVSITVGNLAPTATITSPASSLTYKVGDTIIYSGTGSDPEDGTLTGSALTWVIKIHHCPNGGACHEHSFQSSTGPSGSLVVPDHGNDFHFELILTAKDSGNLTSTASVVIQPQTSLLTLDSNPPGLQLILDGSIANAPIARLSVVGSSHTIEAVSPQGGQAYLSWSDGGARFHTITVPATPLTLTAQYTSPGATIDFNAGPEGVLNGQYPAGVADWGGASQWYLSGPWAGFTTNSVSFSSGALTSASFSFVTPRRLVSLDAYNGGVPTTITLSCPGQPDKQVNIATNALANIQTGWTGTCTTVTIASTNSWDTNFDNLVYDGGGTPPANVVPSVNAGPDLNVTLPAQAALDATVTDDGLPAPPAAVTTAWSKTSGPGTVSFGNAAAVDTTATFSAAGTYVLRLTANDSALQAFDETTVTVSGTPPANVAPSVNAGVDLNVTLPAQAALDGTVTDDGLPAPPAAVTTAWSKTSGPGTVSFGNAAAVDTTATFSAAGTYVLRLTANDSALQAFDETTVTVAAQSSGLVAAYSFNEGTGTMLGDTSGQNNNGTVSGATWNTTGKYGKALSFDGINDRVNINDANSLDLTTGMTLEAWVRPTAAGGWRTVILKERTGHLAYALYGSTAGSQPSSEIVIGTNGSELLGTGALALNTWTHLASTYDGTTLRLYVNGVQVSSKVVGGGITATTGALRIGGNAVWGEYFAGLIDEVRIYNRALSAAEITTDMNAPIDGGTPPANVVPSVNAGPDLNVTLPAQAALDATVTDDGLPAPPAAVTTAWSKTSGPGTVSFGNAAAVDTTATFSAAGTYVLRLTANDSALQAFDETTVTVSGTPPANVAPSVNAGVDLNVTLPAQAALDGTVTDDGLPAPPAAVTTAWSKTSGPGTVSFGNAAAVDTTATFSAAGTYVLRLTANDSALQAFDETTVTVAAQSSGLVAAYSFNEGTGTMLGDTSGQNNNGTVSGATWNTTGKYGKALSFDGINDRVNINDANSLDLTTGMTLEAWVRPTAAGGWRTVILKERTGHLAYALYGSTAGSQPSSEIVIGTNGSELLGTGALALNTWTHLASTYDGTTLRLYVNGVQVSSKVVGGGITATTGALRIGGNAVWGEYFAGLIDEVRIYNRALSAAEITTDMNAPIGGGAVASPFSLPAGMPSLNLGAASSALASDGVVSRRRGDA